MGQLVSSSNHKAGPDPRTYNFSESIHVIGTGPDTRFLSALWVTHGLHSITTLLAAASDSPGQNKRSFNYASLQAFHHLAVPVYFTPQSVPISNELSNQEIIDKSIYTTIPDTRERMMNVLKERNKRPNPFFSSDNCQIPPIPAFTTENFQMVFDDPHQLTIENYSALTRQFGSFLVTVPVIESDLKYHIPTNFRPNQLQTHFSPQFAQNIIQNICAEFFASINSPEYSSSSNTSDTTMLSQHFNTILAKHLNEVRMSLVNQQYCAQFALHNPEIFNDYIFSSSRIGPKDVISRPILGRRHHKPANPPLQQQKLNPTPQSGQNGLPSVCLQPLNQTLLQQQVFSHQEQIQYTRFRSRPHLSIERHAKYKKRHLEAQTRAKSYGVKNGGVNHGYFNHNPYPLLYVVMLDFRDDNSVRIFHNFVSHLYSLYSTLVPTAHLKPINLFIVTLNETPLDEATAHLTIQDVHDLINPLIAHASDHYHHLSVEFHSFGTFPSSNVMEKVVKYLSTSKIRLSRPLIGAEEDGNGDGNGNLVGKFPSFSVHELRETMQTRNGVEAEEYFNFAQRVMELSLKNPLPSPRELMQMRDDLDIEDNVYTAASRAGPRFPSDATPTTAPPKQHWVFTDFYQRQVELLQHLDQFIGTTYLTKLSRDLDLYIDHFKHAVLAQVGGKIEEHNQTQTALNKPPIHVNSLLAPHLSPHLTPLQSHHILSANIHVYSPYHPKVPDYFFSSLHAPLRTPFLKPIFPPASLFKSYTPSQFANGLVEKAPSVSETRSLSLLAAFLQLIPTHTPIASNLSTAGTSSANPVPFKPIGSGFLDPHNVPISLPVLVCASPVAKIVTDLITAGNALHMIGTMTELSPSEREGDDDGLVVDDKKAGLRYDHIPRLSGVLRLSFDSFNQPHVDQSDWSLKSSSEEGKGDKCSTGRFQVPLRLVSGLPSSMSPQLSHIDTAPPLSTRLVYPTEKQLSFQFVNDPRTIYTVSSPQPRIPVSANFPSVIYQPLFNVSPIILSQLKQFLLPQLQSLYPQFPSFLDQSLDAISTVFTSSIPDFDFPDPLQAQEGSPDAEMCVSTILQQFYPAFANCTYRFPRPESQQQQQQHEEKEEKEEDKSSDNDNAEIATTKHKDVQKFTTFPTFHFNQTFHRIATPHLFNHDMPFSEVANFTFVRQRSLDETTPWDLSELSMRLTFHQNASQPHFLFVLYNPAAVGIDDELSPGRTNTNPKAHPDEFTMDSARDLIKQFTTSDSFVEDDEFHEPASALKLYPKPPLTSTSQDYLTRLSSELDSLKSSSGTLIYVYLVNEQDQCAVWEALVEALAISSVYRMRNMK